MRESTRRSALPHITWLRRWRALLQISRPRQQEAFVRDEPFPRPVCANKPNGRPDIRFGQMNPTDNGIFPQTKPTSANEANLENLMKTMLEHEQHIPWLLGQTRARDTAQGVLAKRTQRTDPSPVGRRTRRGGSVTHQPNEPNGQ
jgi:hypothetical protein